MLWRQWHLPPDAVKVSSAFSVHSDLFSQFSSTRMLKFTEPCFLSPGEYAQVTECNDVTEDDKMKDECEEEVKNDAEQRDEYKVETDEEELER